jgi:D-alanyl-D-alanine carboxypeptidase
MTTSHSLLRGAAAAAVLLLTASQGLAGELKAGPPPGQVSAEADLGSAVAALPRPSAVHLEGRCLPQGRSAASGAADADMGRALTVDTPLRIASNTKTFTAATALRLWEQERLDLTAPIAGLVTPALNDLLLARGYDTSQITVRQLLNHTSGLYDHGSDPRFTQALFSDPGRRWSRQDLVALSMSYGGPQGAPGEKFLYSDTGYILLGDIIERVAGQTLAAAVREQLGLNRLGLTSTWWELMEPQPPGAPHRARQFLGEREATAIDASMDLYGGGGLVMSARDMARFMSALFEGKVFARPETLAEMTRPAPHPGGEHYRIGLIAYGEGSRASYGHSGFWGTIVYYSPELGVAVAGVTVNQDGFRALERLVLAEAGLSPENCARG